LAEKVFLENITDRMAILSQFLAEMIDDHGHSAFATARHASGHQDMHSLGRSGHRLFILELVWNSKIASI
jgi:hypothetical protein